MRAPTDATTVADTVPPAPQTLSRLFVDSAWSFTFVNADAPRDAWIAVWPHPEAEASLRLEDVDANVPRDTIQRLVSADGALQFEPTDVLRLDVATYLHHQPVHETGEGSSSARALAAIANWALVAISKTQVQPGLTERGIDSWRIGPLTPEDQQHLEAIARSVPDEMWATRNAIDGFDGEIISNPRQAVDAFATALADRLVRTTAAPLAAGHRAFAAAGHTLIDGRAAARSFRPDRTGRGPLAVLQVAPPPVEDPDGLFTAVLGYQSREAPHRIVSLRSIWSSPPDVQERFRSAEASLLVTLRRAARIWAPIRRLLEQDRPDRIALTAEEVDSLFGGRSNDLGSTGLSILIANELIKSVDFTPVVKSVPSAGRTVSSAGRFDLTSLLSLDWRGEIDGQALTEAELNELAESKRPLIRFRGQWVRIDDAKLRRLRERTTIGTSTALAAALGATIDLDGRGEAIVTVEGPLAELGERIRSLDPTTELAEPATLVGELRPYQQRGLAWLALMADLGLGGILADDMGLGKTIQMIATHLHRQTIAPAPMLVICPASVVGNWEREIHRFAPTSAVSRHVGPNRKLGTVGRDHVVLTTYGVARRDAGLLADIDWGLVVADEAQAIKNPASRTARALRRIPGAARFALTGTPIQNQLTDLWAILDWSTPGLLGPLERFRRDIAVPIERHQDEEATQQLNRLIRPFVLRRTKADPDIVPDLPPKTETDEIVPLTVEQAALYRATVTEVMAEIEAAEGIERKGLVLRLMTRLKQICNHPEHLLAEGGELAGRSGKLTAATDLLETITSEGNAALVFTQYVQMGRLLERHLRSKGLRTLFLHGSVPILERERMVQQFQAGEADVFLLSLRAGGTGLNLTAATHVIHYDRWWNPAVEDQASDRAWRIGQDRPVQIHRMITEGTVEDRIAVLLEEKRTLAEVVVGSGEGWISDLTDDELADLVALSDGEDAIDEDDTDADPLGSADP